MIPRSLVRALQKQGNPRLTGRAAHFVGLRQSRLQVDASKQERMATVISRAELERLLEHDVLMVISPPTC